MIESGLTAKTGLRPGRSTQKHQKAWLLLTPLNTDGVRPTKRNGGLPTLSTMPSEMASCRRPNIAKAAGNLGVELRGTMTTMTAHLMLLGFALPAIENGTRKTERA